MMTVRSFDSRLNGGYDRTQQEQYPDLESALDEV